MSGRSSRPAGSRASDYDYDLPPDRIARYPADRRDESRLLHLPKDGGPLRHLRFRDLPELLSSGDVLVVNESRVLPARLLGRKPTGAPAEILLIRPLEGEGAPRGEGPPWERGHAAAQGAGEGATGTWSAAGARAAAGAAPAGRLAHRWEALVRPGSKLKPGRVVDVADDLRIRIEDSSPGGGRIVRLETPLPVEEALARYGHVPLPPYLEREDEPLDRERYQTVYATRPGSVAAPTAGLHFTTHLLDRIRDRGVDLARIDLEVGVGTFRPVEEEDPSEHAMHAERYRLPEETARLIDAARERGGRVWAVGTTVVRTLETRGLEDGTVEPGAGSTELFVRPPWRFRVVDGLVTNFHLPRSTLLMLVAAFAGYERTMEAYRAAVDEGYRFYSYGDAMVIG